MRFINRTTNQKLSIACHYADLMLSPGSTLLYEVNKKNDWRYGTSMDGSGVAHKLAQEPLEPIQIVLTKPLNPWSSMRASWDGEVIAINVRYLNLETTTPDKLVGSIVHEWTHACGFKHGNNYRTKAKEQYSVPYWAGIKALELMGVP